MSHFFSNNLKAGMFVRDKAGNSIEILAVRKKPDRLGKTVLAILENKYINWYYDDGKFFEFESDFDIDMDYGKSGEKDSLKNLLKRRDKYFF